MPQRRVPKRTRSSRSASHTRHTRSLTLRNVRIYSSFVRGQTIEQLFDTREDAQELKDLRKEAPDVLARLRGIADDYLEKSPHWGDAPTREIGELELNHLRALGYALP